MKSRLTLFLLAVLFFMSSLQLSLFAQEDSRDLAELQELQLADAQQEISRLRDQLKASVVEQESLRDAVSQKNISDDDLKKLKSQNEMLQSELENTDKDLQTALNEKGDFSKQVESIRDEMKRLETKQAAGKARSSEVAELTASCKNLEDENSLVKDELSALKTQLADAETSRDQAQADFAKMFSEEEMFSEDKSEPNKIAESTETVAHLERALVDAESEIVSLKASLAEVRENSGDSQSVAQQLTAEAGAPSEGGSDDAAALFDVERIELKRVNAELASELESVQKAAEAHNEMVNSLKTDLAEAEREKSGLAEEAKALRDRKVDVRSSDLFRDMERVSVTLREKLLQVEGERQRIAKALKKLEARDDRYDEEISHEKALRQKAETDISDARSREVEYQELIERMMAQVPQLEKQVSDLEGDTQELEMQLLDRHEDLNALKIELEKREHRLVKAERVAEVLENAREDMIHASEREKLDMHYNMAAVYARDGKFDEAEQEYLHALRLDPTDADVHYNLGILYDDELKSPAKAVVHYRRYLKLNPHGAEADQVRDWLMKLEMKMKR